MLFSAVMKMAVIFIAIGLPVYIWTRKEISSTEKCFKPYELWIAGILVLIALFAVYAMARGIIAA